MADSGDQAPQTSDATTRRTKLTAGIVTSLIVLAIATTVLSETEAWPLTAFRLFSGTRTEQQSTLALVAVTADGSKTTVTADDDHIFVRRTGHLYQGLGKRPLAEQRAMVTAWLKAAGLRPADFDRVEVVRTAQSLDPDGGPPKVTSIKTIKTVKLR